MYIEVSGRELEHIDRTMQYFDRCVGQTYSESLVSRRFRELNVKVINSDAYAVYCSNELCNTLYTIVVDARQVNQCTAHQALAITKALESIFDVTLSH